MVLFIAIGAWLEVWLRHGYSIHVLLSIGCPLRRLSSFHLVLRLVDLAIRCHLLERHSLPGCSHLVDDVLWCTVRVSTITLRLIELLLRESLLTFGYDPHLDLLVTSPDFIQFSCQFGLLLHHFFPFSLLFGDIFGASVHGTLHTLTLLRKALSAGAVEIDRSVGCGSLTPSCLDVGKYLAHPDFQFLLLSSQLIQFLDQLDILF